MENKENAATLVLGATPNSSRYANIATKRLLGYGHEVVLVGIKQGEIEGRQILNGKPDPEKEIETITLYVGPRHQPDYYDWILRIAPKRVIFNPGTENNELINLLREANIEPVIACTLVMISTGEY